MATTQPRLPLRAVPFRGSRAARKGAQRIAPGYDSRNLAPTGFNSPVRSQPEFGRVVAQHYESAASAPTDETTRNAYRAFTKETADQYKRLTKPVHKGGLGVKVEVVKDDPYASHADLVRDVKQNRRLRVLSSRSTGGAPHELVSARQNNQFRAVHDYFGHVATGRDFSRDGEEAAFQSHSQMYSPEARPAMATETRGQNTALIYGKSGGFPQQKAIAMPHWATERSQTVPSHLSPQQFRNPSRPAPRWEQGTLDLKEND